MCLSSAKAHSTGYKTFGIIGINNMDVSGCVLHLCGCGFSNFIQNTMFSTITALPQCEGWLFKILYAY